jgi:hypothetical protein
MTTLTVVPSSGPAAAPLGRRVWNALRLHLANPWTTIGLPWAIFGTVFLLNYAIWALIAAAAGGRGKLDPNAFAYNGGSGWVLVFLVVAAVQAMSLTFRFAIGLGMTRRDYYLGTAAYLAAMSLTFGIAMAAFAQVERVSDGWGLGGRFFQPWFLPDASFLELTYDYTVAGLVLASIGAAAATMWVRWKALGLYVFFVGLAAVVIGGLWLVSVTSGWDAVGDYLDRTSPVVVVTWGLPVAALCLGAGWLLLRRATPRE